MDKQFVEVRFFDGDRIEVKRGEDTMVEPDGDCYACGFFVDHSATDEEVIEMGREIEREARGLSPLS